MWSGLFFRWRPALIFHLDGQARAVGPFDLICAGDGEPVELWHTRFNQQLRRKGERMVRLAMGIAIGYVLGSRAGRGHYEKLKRWVTRVVDHPAVQGAAGFARAKLSDLTGQRR